VTRSPGTNVAAGQIGDTAWITREHINTSAPRPSSSAPSKTQALLTFPVSGRLRTFETGRQGPTDTVPSTVDYRSAGACGQVVGSGAAVASGSVRALRASVRCGGGRV
jgi:hypothetical protein